MKKCTKCQTEKSLEEFNKHKNKPDGHQNVCKDCAKQISQEYYKNNSEKHKETVREYKKNRRMWN